MKSTKAKLAKKLKSIRPSDYLKQDQVLRVLAAADGLVEYLPKITNSITQIKPKPIQKEPKEEVVVKEKRMEEKSEKIYVGIVQESKFIDFSELMRDLEEEEKEEDETSGIFVGDKENIRPMENSKDPEISTKAETGNSKKTVLFSENYVLNFRRPDLNSNSLFDPNLLAAFEEAVKEYRRMSEANRRARIEKEEIPAKLQNLENVQKKLLTEQTKVETEEEAEQNEGGRRNEEAEPLFKTRRIDETTHQETQEGNNPLVEFEERCPPGGEGSVILYSTTLRGIRKTFDDCNKIRFLLDNFRVLYCERDVSMHRDYKEELWRIMKGQVSLPVLFVKGRCIGGAQEVVGLHEQGKLRVLFESIPVTKFGDSKCETCNGVRFVMCFSCSGSHKVVSEDGLRSECLVCNENGLVVCPFCC